MTDADHHHPLAGRLPDELERRWLISPPDDLPPPSGSSASRWLSASSGSDVGSAWWCRLRQVGAQHDTARHMHRGTQRQCCSRAGQTARVRRSELERPPILTALIFFELITNKCAQGGTTACYHQRGGSTNSTHTMCRTLCQPPAFGIAVWVSVPAPVPSA